MKYQLFYTKRSVQDLQGLDKTVSQNILKKLKKITSNPNPLINSKSLKGIYKNLYRFRIGDYRAIFSKDAKGNLIILTIIRIGHRKDIYH